MSSLRAWRPMWMAVVLAIACAACGGSPRPAASGPVAAEGVRTFIDALRSDDPAPAYALLTADVRAELSFEEFALGWKQRAAEREQQARALEEGLRGDPNLGERATLGYGDGKTVHLLREDGQWRLESALVTRRTASRPHDAVKVLAEALRDRDFEATLDILTERRREGIGQQVDEFVRSLVAHQNDKIDIIGKDRAELRWDEGDLRYKIVLRKEGDQWRVDDVHIRPAPTDEEPTTDEPEAPEPSEDE